MSEKPRTWPAIFDIWRDAKNPTDGRMCRNLAADIGAHLETVRQWYKSGAVPAHYWRALVQAIARRAGICITCEDLAEATEQLRPPKLREEAA